MTFDEWWKGRSHLFPEGWVRSIVSDAWLAALESREEWVSVSDRLPEPQELCLIRTMEPDTHLVTMGGFRDLFFEWGYSGSFPLSIVTEWLPLAPPSTPSPEEKGTR